MRSKGAPRQRQASPRVLIAAAAIVSQSASQSSWRSCWAADRRTRSPTCPRSVARQRLPWPPNVNALFKGIPQSGTTLGRATAPVTMTEFIDPQCPYCREFETTVLPSIVKNYVRTGKLRIQMEPWAFIGPDSIRGQAAELAAAEQNRAFNYAELLYDNQGIENTGWLNDNMSPPPPSSIPGSRPHPPQRALIRSGQGGTETGRRPRTTDKTLGTPTLYVGRTGTKGAR